MSSKAFKPYQQTVINTTITTGKLLSLSQDKISFKTVVEDDFGDKIVIPYYDVITKYHHAIKPYIQSITLTEDELNRYKYKPNLYCYEQYGTPELWSSLLYINNMLSMTEFTKDTINIFKTNIMSIINELISLNTMDLKKNRIDNDIN